MKIFASKKRSLFAAVENNDLVVMSAVLNKGVSPNFSRTSAHFSSDGKITPLMLAVYNNNLEIVNLLLQHNADANAMHDLDGMYVSPLLMSLKRCHITLTQGFVIQSATAQLIYNVLKDHNADLKALPNQIPFRGDMSFANAQYDAWDASVDQQMRAEDLSGVHQQLEHEYEANRLKNLLESEISPAQYATLPRRKI